MSVLTRYLLATAALFGGLLAGLNVDRAIVAMPAWQHVGAEAWADFSRHADLGNGLFLYPLEAIASFALTLSAALCFHFDRRAPRGAALPLYGAVVLAAGGLVLTAKAAPIMLSIRETADLQVLNDAFQGFYFWGNVRGLLQVLCFVAQLRALVALQGRRRDLPRAT
jgi:hypothetical protein